MVVSLSNTHRSGFFSSKEPDELALKLTSPLALDIRAATAAVAAVVVIGVVVVVVVVVVVDAFHTRIPAARIRDRLGNLLTPPHAHLDLRILPSQYHQQQQDEKEQGEEAEESPLNCQRQLIGTECCLRIYLRAVTIVYTISVLYVCLSVLARYLPGFSLRRACSG